MKRTQTKIRRVLALFLALMTFTSLCIPPAFAAEESAGSPEIVTPETGDNTQSSPTDVVTPSVVATRSAEGWLKEAVYGISLTGETGIQTVSIQSGDLEAVVLTPDEEGKYFFTVNANGEYTICVTDTAGTEYTHALTETNIDNEAPVLSEISQEVQEGGADVLYSFTAADSGSGLATVTVTIGEREPVSLTLTEDGNYAVTAEADARITVTAADALANSRSIQNFDDSANSAEALPDTDAPVLEALRSADGWTNEAAYEIKATDASGVASITVQHGDEEPVSLTAASEGTYLFAVSENGTYTVTATDNAGNAKQISISENRIDTEAPVISEIDRAAEENAQQATYTFTVTDAASGIDSVSVTIGEAESMRLEASADGSYQFTVSHNAEILIEAMDAAGNTASAVIQEYQLASEEPSEDTEAPVIEVTRESIEGEAEADWIVPVEYTISATDNSGIASVTVQFNDGDAQKLTAGEDGRYKFTAEANGEYTFTAADAAGNTATAATVETKIDEASPVISNFQRESFEITEDVYLVATYSFSATDAETGIDSVIAVQGIVETEVEYDEESGLYLFFAEENDVYTFVVTDKAGNMATKTVEETGLTQIVEGNNSLASPGTLATEFASSHLINSASYMGLDIQYLKNNNLFFNVYNLAGGSSSYYNVSAQIPSWKWSLYDGTTGTYPTSIKPSIAYNSQAYDATNGQAMGTETTSAGKPDVSTIISKGMVCLGYPNYYYFNYLPNVVGKETFSDGSYIDYKAGTAYLREFFNTYTYTTTGLVMEHCPGTIELWREALDEAANNNASNPYFTVTRWSTTSGSLSDSQIEAIYDQMSPGDVVIHSGDVGNGYTTNSHIGLYAGSRDVVKNWYLGDAYTTIVDEHFFVDMTPDGIGLYSGSYLGMDDKSSGVNTWYHIEWKKQIPEEKGAIQVYKKDTSGKNLAGAMFLITSNSDPSLVYELGPTDANGYAIVSGVEYDTYTVKETVFPSGYTSNGTTEWTVTVGSSTQTVTINAVNKEIPTEEGDGKIEVYKKDPSGNNLSGAEFKVTNTSTGTSYTMGPTNANGYASVSNLPYGTYTVQETKFPDGYTVSGTNSWTATVSASTKTFTINAVNEEVPTIPQLIIVKTTNTGKDLSGWQFKVTYKKYGFITTTVGTYTTGADGTVTITDLEAGTAYTVTEVASSSSYWKCDTSSKSVTLEDGKTTTISFYNEYCGKIKVTKTTNTGSNKSGWVFDVKDLSGNTVATLTTGSDGTATSGNIPAGTYTVTERGTDDAYWSCDVAPKVVTVVGGSTANVTVNNNHYGRIKVQKTTNTGNNLSGWVFVVKNSSGATVATLTTGADGTATTGNLTPGTYSVTEKSNNNQYWECDVSAKTVTVAGGSTQTVTVNNNHYGKLKVTKYTNTGSNRSGWIFDVKNSSGTVVATLTTASDGTATSGNLAPGEYTVVERSNGDSYWTCDVSAKKVTIVAGATVGISVTNTHYGKIKVTKTTNTGNNRSGWSFDIKDASGAVVETITTGSDGTATSGKLLPGKYTVTEQGSNDPYWSCDVTGKNATVTAGYTTNLTVNNIHRGRAQVIKKTNTGNNLVNWQFGIYSDANCTNHVGTVKSGSDGKSDVLYLEPGTYYWKEIGNTDGLFNSEYWPSNATVQALVISAGQQTTVEHTNIHYGKIKMIKKMATDGPLDGWVFHIYDASGAEVTGSPFTTAADGTIVTGVLLPGTYTVKEDLPSNNLYYCKSDNPQTVTVTAGQTASVEFTNALRPGKIEITKVNFSGQKLADAKFMLEWSEDGVNWTPVQFSTKEDVVKGGCTSPNLTADGTLITDASGVITFETLYPTLKYRVTEVEAPEGYVLLKEAAFTGELPIEDLTVDLKVYNGRNYVLPATGVDDGLYSLVSIGTSLLLLAVVVSFMLIAKTVPNGKYAEVDNHHKKGKNKNA